MPYKKRPMKKRVIKRRRGRVAKKSFASRVTAVLRRQAETKTAYTSNSESALTSFNSGIDSTADLQQVLPNVADGPGENQRVGDKITIVNHQVRGYIRFTPVLKSPTNDKLQVGVRLMCLSLKKTSSWDLATAAPGPLNALLRAGGTNKSFSGLISDLQCPINTDMFDVHYDRKMYLTQTYNNFDTASGFYHCDTSNQIKFYRFNIKKARGKNLKYDDSTNSSLLPVNYAPFLVLGYTYLNSGAADTVSANCGLHFQSTLTYKDI